MIIRHRPRPVLAGAQPASEGQALVEFTLILIPLMLIFLGILQFGILFSGQLGLINSTREGARYGATLISAGSSADAATVYCYTFGMNSSGANCTVGGTTQTGTFGRAMPGYNKANVCRTATGNCSTASSVSYCYITDPNLTTYSLRLNVTAVYRHPLFIPLISVVVDLIDGHTDNALAAGTTESFRVEGPSFATPPTGVSACTN